VVIYLPNPLDTDRMKFNHLGVQPRFTIARSQSSPGKRVLAKIHDMIIKFPASIMLGTHIHRVKVIEKMKGNGSTRLPVAIPVKGALDQIRNQLNAGKALGEIQKIAW